MFPLSKHSTHQLQQRQTQTKLDAQWDLINKNFEQWKLFVQHQYHEKFTLIVGYSFLFGS